MGRYLDTGGRGYLGLFFGQTTEIPRDCRSASRQPRDVGPPARCYGISALVADRVKLADFSASVTHSPDTWTHPTCCVTRPVCLLRRRAARRNHRSLASQGNLIHLTPAEMLACLAPAPSITSRGLNSATSIPRHCPRSLVAARRRLFEGGLFLSNRACKLRQRGLS